MKNSNFGRERSGYPEPDWGGMYQALEQKQKREHSYEGLSAEPQDVNSLIAGILEEDKWQKLAARLQPPSDQPN